VDARSLLRLSPKDLPRGVLIRICQAIKASPVVEEETKELLDKP
jgi:hypothetical protein